MNKNENINILMVSMDFPPVPGGISAHVFELSKALAAAGQGVTVLTRKKNDNRRVQNSGARIYEIPLKGVSLTYGLQIRHHIGKLIPDIKPDIIHIHGMGPLEWYNIKDIPLAYTNHTSGYLMRIQKGGFRRMMMLKRLFKKPDLFLAPSKELLEVPFPIPARKVFIPNGVDAAKYAFNAEKRMEIRKQLRISNDEVVAVVTRRLVPKNGVIYLARATRYLKNDRIRFIIIGNGPERDPIETEFVKNCGKRVMLLGNKTHDDIIDYYSAADFSILPSLMEATSISGLEAMAASLPLVGTRVGGIPELIKEGENGFLCRPADPGDLANSINHLLSNDLKSLGHASRTMVENDFEWNRIAEKTLQAYKTLL
ncbi:MAG: glycosyltransferase family 4 protein [Pseudomonadota bacterium]